MNKILLRISAGLVMFLFMFSIQDTFATASLGRGVQKNMPAADFTLESIGGTQVSLADFKGEKGAILFFFTTWCPYCRQKFPDLNKEYENYRAENIELLVIDVGESKLKVSSFSAKESPSFDILLDIDMKVAHSYGVMGVPTFVLISKSGLVVYEGNDLPGNAKELLAK